MKRVDCCMCFETEPKMHLMFKNKTLTLAKNIDNVDVNRKILEPKIGDMIELPNRTTAHISHINSNQRTRPDMPKSKCRQNFGEFSQSLLARHSKQ